MKKFFGILLVIALCLVGVIYVIVERIEKEELELKQDHEEQKLQLTKINASLVIDSVELAYTTALTKNMGTYPTLEQVKNNFNNEHAIWNSNDKITSLENNFECSVVIQEQILKVNCLDYETTSNLIIRN